ncbi:MAG TPA: ion channel [Chitinophagaceae bacterium]|nr:ion channel [Chitinophagaceae bacterium]
MALRRNINTHSKATGDTGFGTSATTQGGRFINRDGTFNIRRTGIPFFERFSLYTSMLTMSTWKFLGVVFLFYIGVNLGFALIYWLNGVSHLIGVPSSGSQIHDFIEAFFFSSQTFTTVGYGRISPGGMLTNTIASMESLIGVLSLAIATGMFYGRFTRPMANIRFSKVALIAPYQEMTALMFRLAPYKDYHHLTDVEIRVVLGLTLEEHGKPVFKFYPLHLERNRIDSLSMNWTIVHPIDEHSPIAGFSEKDIESADVEVMVTLRAFDHLYSSTVQQATSYTGREIHFGGKFIMMFRESEDGQTTILELDKLDRFDPVELPAHKLVAG